ncbi:formiminotransferase N-terminal subdomain-containing protein isoform X2 [Solea solea]|uniref:formiminotransferase N-terminal subdomain-containing protein isoform X2 n=1 Tax=Solea solea TaxID=90069 RepID=UPI00272D6314|nr:formiminotransferase N-terminal subdomain-containing protein isoform X2 [Solea solea]
MASSSSSLGRRLVACLLNISEARRKDVVETVAKAALYNTEGVQREATTVLNIFNDHDYNRSVITIVSSIDSISEAVLSACEKACGLIDMCAHKGVHPCMGAVDLIPIYPLGEEVRVQDCAEQAQGETTCGSGTHNEGPGHHGLPVWLGGLPSSPGAGAEEEGDGLVQEDAGPADPARHRATATEEVWCHRCWSRCVRHELQRHYRHPGRRRGTQDRRGHQRVHPRGPPWGAGHGFPT